MIKLQLYYSNLLQYNMQFNYPEILNTTFMNTFYKPRVVNYYETWGFLFDSTTAQYTHPEQYHK